MSRGILLSCWFLVTAALSDILFVQERKLESERAPLYRAEVVLGLLALGRFLWLVSFVVIGLYDWKLLLVLSFLVFLSSRIFLDNLVERFLLIPFCMLLMALFGKGKGD
jgi:hypothetical protein